MLFFFFIFTINYKRIKYRSQLRAAELCLLKKKQILKVFQVISASENGCTPSPWTSIGQ